MSTEIDEETYRRLKQEVEDARRNAERAKGALEQLMKNLKATFGCDTLKEAKALLEDLEAQNQKAQEKFERLFKDYQRKWNES